MRRLVKLAVVGLATLAPSWAHADDEQIAQDILQKLQTKKEAGLLKGFGIDLAVENGTVWMKGFVSSADQSRMALEIARGVSGVEQVVNDLEVKQSAKAVRPVPQALVEPIAEANAQPTPCPEPSRVERDEPAYAAPPAPRALRTERPIASQQLPVLKEPATVKPNLLSSLTTGFVKPKAMPTASQPAKKPSLVRQVNYEESSATKSETPKTSSADSQQIVQTVAQRLNQEKQAGKLKGFNVDLQCDEGVLWVSGHVSNKQQHELVIDIARRVKGVKQVVNDLKIQEADATATAKTPAAHADHSVPAALGTGVAKTQHTTAANSATPRPLAAAPSARPLPTMMGPNGVQMVAIPVQMVPAGQANMPLAFAPASFQSGAGAPIPMGNATPMPMHMAGPGAGGIAAARYDHPNLPGYAWPSYAAYPNYAAVTYPKQYSPSAWPYIGPFYPYPQVPLGWRKVQLQWDDGWWQLDFKDK